MHDTLIKNWNSVVGNKDNVWVLGDVAYGPKADKYLPLLNECNGNKRLVLDNHDTYDMNKYLLYFDRVFGCMSYKECILSHIPIHSQQFYRWKLNIHGHVHHEDPILVNSDRYFNVCCEHINYTPISWEEIKKLRVEQLKN